ncbi:MAG: RIP metalloprotease RseP [Clostridia bacterium]|nr:RIP metalloprotease RseP [Clostridia bacterium]
MTWLAVVLVLGGLIFAHELGHFLVAKAKGVQVDEFALGFGPLILGARKGETLYSLRLLPLGGFVRMAGMYPEGRLPPDERLAAPGAEGVPVAPGRGFSDKPVGARMAIIAAGPAMNVFVAVLLFVVAYGWIGIPTPDLTVSRLVPGYPAEAAGIAPGDRIVAIDGTRLHTWQDLQEAVQPAAGRELQVDVERRGRRLVFRVTPREEGGVGVIGVYPELVTTRYSPLRAVGAGLADTVAVVSGWFVGIAAIFTGHGAGGIMGPVGIADTIAEASRTGLVNVLVLAAVISINLGLVNILPIPALDGSRLAFLAWEAVRGRPVDPEKEGFVHFVGFALLILLILVVTFHDVLRIAGG